MYCLKAGEKKHKEWKGGILKKKTSFLIFNFKKCIFKWSNNICYIGHIDTELYTGLKTKNLNDL